VAAPAPRPDAAWSQLRAEVRGAIAARLGERLAGELLPKGAHAGELADELARGQPLPTSFVALAEHYPVLLANDHRKQHGAWFTPLELAQPTADRTLALLGDVEATRSLRVVDPAVGGGTFLRAAFRTLRARGLSATAALASLHGVDVDATAAVLAALAVWEEAGCLGDPRDIARRVHHGDGLLDLADGSFDAVLTNPPWETLQATTDSAARIAALRPRFRRQGRGKLYTYRLFVERAHALLRPGGALGLIVPASLWFDRDAEPLRTLLLDDCDWQWLFGFENRKKVFAIDGRYRFGAIVARRGGPTARVRVAFGRTELADWCADAPTHTAVPREALRALSPSSGAFVEADDPRDLELLLRMQRGGVPLTGARGLFAWRQGDFNMTSDRAQFVPRDDAEQRGYVASDDGVWRAANAPELLPLLQGAMVGDLHPNVGAHQGGTGHRTQWRATDDARRQRPAYLVDAAAWRAAAAQRAPFRVVHRALGNASNERSMFACLMADAPCGNSLGVLTPRPQLAARARPLRQLAAAAALLSSLAFDWTLRQRLAGTNLNQFVLADCVLPPHDAFADELAALALRLCALLPLHAPLWTFAQREGWAPSAGPATTNDERQALLTRIDVLATLAYGLTDDDVAWITRDCERPADELARRPTGTLAKGFWRLDRTLPPALRRPNRWRRAIGERQYGAPP
jgi:SAM-dependent methyltransferase